MGKIKDIAGKKFGKLKVIEFSHLDKTKGLSFWKCKCDCGNECVKCGCWMGRGQIKSCGCLAHSARLKNIKNVKCPRNEGIYDGEKKHPSYTTWCGMKRRCYQPNCKEFRWYGEKGIKLYHEWVNNPEVFVKWAKENGYEKGLCIDRIDVNGDYEPKNCQFITRVENLKKIRKDNLKNGYQYSRNRTPVLEGIID